MKIFSVILATLFLLGFTSASYAEDVYTITNKSDGTVMVFFDDTSPLEMLVESTDYFELKFDECVKLTEHQFYNLQSIAISAALGKRSTTLCERSECTKQHDNYEILNKENWTPDDAYEIKAVKPGFFSMRPLTKLCKKRKEN